MLVGIACVQECGGMIFFALQFNKSNCHNSKNPSDSSLRIPRKRWEIWVDQSNIPARSDTIDSVTAQIKNQFE